MSDLPGRRRKPGQRRAAAPPVALPEDIAATHCLPDTRICCQPKRSQDLLPGAQIACSPPPRRFWQLKAGLAALLMASAVIGLVLAALFLGSIIAALLVILVVMVSVVVAIKAVIHHAARVRDKRRRYVAREC